MRTLALSLLLLFAAPFAVDVAIADPVTAEPSAPLVNATETADTGWDLVEQYGPIWGGMLLAFGVGSAFLKRNEEEHWIRQGRTLAIVVASVGTLGAVLEAQLGDATWAGVIVTLFAAVKMVISPTVPPKKTTVPKISTVDLLIVVPFIGALALASCGPRPGPAPVIGQAIVDCTGDNRAQIDSLFAELSPLVFAERPDWSAVYQRAKHAGVAIGGCVIAELVQTYLGGRRALPEQDTWTARQTLEEFRGAEAGGATFKTRFGNL